MTFFKLVSSILTIGFAFTLNSCDSFEREKELALFLQNEKNIDIDTVESLNVYVLQDNICGACTGNVLSYMYNSEKENSLVIVSDENEKLLAQLKENMAGSKLCIVPSLKIERYGLRYASDIFISFRKGKLNFWSFMEEENFDKISKHI